MSDDGREFYTRGDRVRVLDGPFDKDEATVLDADQMECWLSVGVTVAGCEIPIQVEPWQVEKLH